MFDPFGDFETKGYLRNIERIKDLNVLKRYEHLFFEANIERALSYLQSIKGNIEYSHFLMVHEIIFKDFYPWAGCDRASLGVGRLVSKGQRVQFEASERSQRAVEWGLSKGNDPVVMQREPGVVMGAFAWGHPFLDGNGRTMLLVHAELCRRAKIFINWNATRKEDYLESLTLDINDPQGNHLNKYLLPFISQLKNENLLDHLKSLVGLNGQSSTIIPDIAYHADDPVANAAYEEAKRLRGELF
ncbi:Fic family protein [Pectobacterium sp. CHL-2024]|uniref:Fic family protein n=1 Tax=Pectobacterium TaxID=122277 RepID=UPI00300E0D38